MLVPLASPPVLGPAAAAAEGAATRLRGVRDAEADEPVSSGKGGEADAARLAPRAGSLMRRGEGAAAGEGAAEDGAEAAGGGVERAEVGAESSASGLACERENVSDVERSRERSRKQGRTLALPFFSALSSRSSPSSTASGSLNWSRRR